MVSVKQYCIENINNLQSYIQESFTWKSNYFIDELNGYNILNDIPDELDRKHILKTISEKKYRKAFIEIMLWGGIGSKPGSNTSKKTEILKKILNYPENKINDIFEKILKENFQLNNYENIRKIYNSLEKNGDYKIPQVDVSFFTKILSFVSEVSKNENKLLIYDKWTKLLHVHLLFDDKDENLYNYYSKRSITRCAF